MKLIHTLAQETIEPLKVYWILARVTVPITLGAELLSRFGVIEGVSPVFAPVMQLLGLPPELGFAWVSAMIVGLWSAVPLVFTLVPVSDLSTADITVFSALILFAHALPLEQKIIQKAGPRFAMTTFLRVWGGLVYAFMLHTFCEATGWLSEPVNPTWIPVQTTPEWGQFIFDFAETMMWVLIILVALFWMMRILKVSGVLNWIMWGLCPIMRLCGIQKEAGHLTAIGLVLGISYGAGFLIKEAQTGGVSARQVCLSCVFMGFAHSIIEDTLIMVAIGADVYGVLVGRVVFAIGATAAFAILLNVTSDRLFYRVLFTPKDKTPAVAV